jgi:hypothetical protein
MAFMASWQNPIESLFWLAGMSTRVYHQRILVAMLGMLYIRQPLPWGSDTLD